MLSNFAFYCCVKTAWSERRGAKRVYFSLQLSGHMPPLREVRVGQHEPEAGTEAEPVEECCFLARSPCFPIHPRTSVQGEHNAEFSGITPSHQSLIHKMFPGNQMVAFSQLRILFPDNSSWFQVYKKTKNKTQTTGICTQSSLALYVLTCSDRGEFSLQPLISQDRVPEALNPSRGVLRASPLDPQVMTTGGSKHTARRDWNGLRMLYRPLKHWDESSLVHMLLYFRSWISQDSLQ